MLFGGLPEGKRLDDLPTPDWSLAERHHGRRFRMVSAVEYLRAQKVRTLIRRDYDAAFQECDVLLTPTAPTPAFALGEKTSDPLEMYLADIFTLPPSLAGLPAISTPCGLSSGGLPLGVQFTAPPFAESILCRVAQVVEDAVGLVNQVPPAFA